MSLQTEWMRQTTERIISVYDNGNDTFSGVELVNHPTPSGCERWLPTYSDNRQWPDAETAKREFEAVLPAPSLPPTLSELTSGEGEVEEDRRCRECGCKDFDCSECIERTGAPCFWVEDDLCSACAEAD